MAFYENTIIAKQDLAEKDIRAIKEKYNDLIFISPSNINPEFSNNIISIGVSLDSQLSALSDFIKKQKN